MNYVRQNKRKEVFAVLDAARLVFGIAKTWEFADGIELLLLAQRDDQLQELSEADLAVAPREARWVAAWLDKNRAEYHDLLRVMIDS